MKVRIPEGTDMTQVKCLTMGKEYTIKGSNYNGWGGSIQDDKGFPLFIFILDSAHLEGQAWEIVE
jgi:hypothetical protein